MVKLVKIRKISKPVFGITYERYMQLVREEIVPKPDKGKIDFIQATKAIIEYYRKLAESHGELSLTDERRALIAIKKEREKLKLETERGNLVPKEQISSTYGLLVSNAKIELRGLPRRVAEFYSTLSDPREIELNLMGEIKEILVKLSKPLRRRRKWKT